jgi:L-ribulose-5-phosphate 3-epimerase
MTADEAGREKRIEFYRNAIEIANDFGTNVVSIWSGILHERLGHQEAMNRLVSGLEEVLAEAEKHDVTVGFEPEPGMFIDTMARYDALKAKLPSPSLKLTLDIGHLHCQGELPIAEYVKRYAGELVNVHIEDMRRGVHEHLPLGEGEIHFPPVLQAIAESNYSGGVHVELSRHSHDGPPMAKRAYEFLRKTMDRTGWSG